MEAYDAAVAMVCLTPTAGGGTMLEHYNTPLYWDSARIWLNDKELKTDDELLADNNIVGYAGIHGDQIVSYYISHLAQVDRARVRALLDYIVEGYVTTFDGTAYRYHL